MQIYDGSRIRAVTEKGLTYEDDNGEEQFIDFQQCYETNLAAWLSNDSRVSLMTQNQMSDEDWNFFVERIKAVKTVGKRNILTPPWADGPFLEFLTSPPVRFKFNTQDSWRTVRHAIESFGWRTHDLS